LKKTRGKKEMENKSYMILGAFVALALIVIVAFVFIDRSLTAGDETNLTSKVYDSVTKTVTIKDKDNIKEISKIKLITPLNVVTGYGGVFKVAEFTITNYEDKDVSDALKKIEFYNKKDMQSIERTFEYKVKSYEEVDVDDYEEVCSIGKGNITETCESVITGKHKERKEVWLPLVKVKFDKDENITIGIFTYVYKDDYVEWIPTFYDQKISEWATWSSGLNTGLRGYYSFEDGSGTSVKENISAVYNLTLLNTPTWIAGKIGNGLYFNSASTESAYVNGANYNNNSGDYATSLWVRIQEAPGVSGYKAVFTTREVTRKGNALMLYVNQMKYGYGVGDNVYVPVPQPTKDIWYHFVVNYISSSKNISIYINGVLSNTTIDTGTYTLNNDRMRFFGGYEVTTGDPLNGTLDEVGFWNRTLTNQEISDLYNGGNGITYALTQPPAICNFSGYVKDGGGAALNMANITIVNQADASERYTTNSSASGYWTVNITNSTKTFVAYTYYNNTLAGGIKPYISGQC
jgi:hypothetical protein